MPRPTPYAVRPSVRRVAGLVVAALVFGLPPSAGAAPAPGSSGIGDPYFPLDGNGGIDVVRYEIHDGYEFGRKRLSGSTRLTVEATQRLTRFNLDFLLPVSKVTVDGVEARFAKPDPHELRITPASRHRRRRARSTSRSGTPATPARSPTRASGTGSPTGTRSWP